MSIGMQSIEWHHTNLCTHWQ